MRKAPKQSTRELTFRERQVAVGLCGGMSTRTIGKILGISHNTCHMHVQSIQDKTGYCGRMELALGLNAAIRDKLWEEQDEAPDKKGKT